MPSTMDVSISVTPDILEVERCRFGSGGALVCRFGGWEPAFTTSACECEAFPMKRLFQYNCE